MGRVTMLFSKWSASMNQKELPAEEIERSNGRQARGVIAHSERRITAHVSTLKLKLVLMDRIQLTRLVLTTSWFSSWMELKTSGVGASKRAERRELNIFFHDAAHAVKLLRCWTIDSVDFFLCQSKSTRWVEI